MEPETVERDVLELLQPIAQSEDAVVELVRLRARGSQTSLQVIVDRGRGVDSLPLDQVADLSRLFSEALDSADPVGGSYDLEVSTPGAESELRELRHYKRNLGRKLRVKLKTGEKLEGTLAGVSPLSFQLDTPSGRREISFQEVRRARPRVTF